MPLIGVAGGSGSGKTTLARELHRHFGPEESVIVLQDSYYIDRSREFRGDGSVNFDHPEALDWDLMTQQLLLLKAGKAARIPVYDFATHTRRISTLHVNAKPIILVDGILIYHAEPLRQIFDLKLYVDCAESLRFQRRLKRDVEERGRTAQGVKVQYQQTVLPMHNQFVEPTKKFADMVLSGESDFFIEPIAKMISKLLMVKP